MGAGAIGAVTVDHRLGGLAVLAWGQVAEQRRRDYGVAAGGWADSAAQMTSLSGSAAMWAL
jgi:hypothetical protein